MEFKEIAVDVDGTITFSDRSIDCRAVKALRNMKVPVIIAVKSVADMVTAGEHGAGVAEAIRYILTK